ncbi:hypothetical protein [Amycolatopsis nalaikhensis]|uniref:Uncharacterized protein n=1 Tax=Amycolatopsis nalaikhensis TaxID=715472 RepID=A0ABY8XJ57_9PSEU|nr:hypothetical protein [Amycolatopsis sp. 2-2]WIV55651.1 hypothetical protein QP939_43715 [Amycolatopsis sp. 2-2]
MHGGMADGPSRGGEGGEHDEHPGPGEQPGDGVPGNQGGDRGGQQNGRPPRGGLGVARAPDAGARALPMRDHAASDRRRVVLHHD